MPNLNASKNNDYGKYTNNAIKPTQTPQFDYNNGFKYKSFKHWLVKTHKRGLCDPQTGGGAPLKIERLISNFAAIVVWCKCRHFFFFFKGHLNIHIFNLRSRAVVHTCDTNPLWSVRLAGVVSAGHSKTLQCVFRFLFTVLWRWRRLVHFVSVLIYTAHVSWIDCTPDQKTKI